MLKALILAAMILLNACATTGDSFLHKGKQYSEAASLRPIRFSRKNELRFWRLGWVVSGRVVSEESLSFYGQYDKRTDQFHFFEKKMVDASKDFASDLQKLSHLNGKRLTCDSDVFDWPVYVVEGNWQGQPFTFFANIDLCTSEDLKILQKYSGYQEMVDALQKK